VLLGAYLVILLLPVSRSFFALAAPGATVILPALVGSALAICGLAVIDDRFIPGRPG
jgi:hypothetical protein